MDSDTLHNEIKAIALEKCNKVYQRYYLSLDGEPFTEKGFKKEIQHEMKLYLAHKLVHEVDQHINSKKYRETVNDAITEYLIEHVE